MNWKRRFWWITFVLATVCAAGAGLFVLANGGRTVAAFLVAVLCFWAVWIPYLLIDLFFCKLFNGGNEDRENPIDESRKISKKTALLAIVVAILIFYFLYKKAIDDGFQGF
jgi:amino acid transporter